MSRFSRVTPSYFRKVYENARADHPVIREATSEFVGGVKGTTFLHWSDGVNHAGCAVRPDGELVYVFSTVPGMGDAIVEEALVYGADHLDCFDGYLPRLYSRHGFVIVDRAQNWTPGGPDVVWMRTVDGMIADGWTVESAFYHRDGQCDVAICGADHTYPVEAYSTPAR